MYLRTTKNDIHQALTAVHHRLSFLSSHLVFTSTIPQKRCLVIVLTCDSLYPCTPYIISITSARSSWYFTTATTSDFWLLQSLLYRFDKGTYWYPLPRFPQDTDHWFQWPKHHSLDLCNLKYMILEAHIFQVSKYFFSVLSENWLILGMM